MPAARDGFRRSQEWWCGPCVRCAATPLLMSSPTGVPIGSRSSSTTAPACGCAHGDCRRAALPGRAGMRGRSSSVASSSTGSSPDCRGSGWARRSRRPSRQFEGAAVMRRTGPRDRPRDRGRCVRICPLANVPPRARAREGHCRPCSMLAARTHQRPRRTCRARPTRCRRCTI